jgi:pyruvate kinase
MSSCLPKTKIVCTLGPSTNTPETVEKLIHAGMNVVRINFSHGSQQEHGATIKMVRDVAKRCKQEIAILADLQGPKIRTNRFPGGSIILEKGQEVRIIHSEEDGKEGLITTTFAPLITDATVGERILMDDGMIELTVSKKDKDALICTVVYGGSLKDRKGINLPSTKLKVTAMTDKDRSDAEFVIPLEVDFIALSFVRSAEDVAVLRKVIDDKNSSVKIVAKIEKPEAIEDLTNILHASDAVMVARGDLAVEAGNEKVPSLQKHIINQALCHGVPVITATQMLESMINNPTPTRAEASDVANAIFDGTDAVMLSGETAAGKYPLETVEMMRKIILDAESKEMFFNFDNWEILDKNRTKFGMSVAKSTTALAKESGAKAFGAYSHTGKAAVRLTSQRPQIPVYVFSSSIESVRRMNLVRGAYGIFMGHTPNPDKVFIDMEGMLLTRELITPGDTVVYTTGIPMTETETTNTIHIRVTPTSRSHPLRYPS